MKLYLASASPRRAELLRQIGVRFDRISAEVDERWLGNEDIASYVLRLALAKARAGWQQLGDCADALVLGADTAIQCQGEILGKPGNREDAARMLSLMAGREHRVCSAVALVSAAREESRLAQTAVQLRAISAAEAQAYWQTGEPRDKAGGYAIQGLGAVFVTAIQGSYSAVVGLPLAETAELLGSFGLPIWQSGLST